MNAKEYIEQLAQSSGLTQEVKDSMLKAVAENEKFAKGLEENVMLRSDYSRNLNALDAEKKKTTDYYSQLLNWKAEQDRLYAESVNGNGNGNGDQHAEYLTKKDMEALEKRNQEELNRREQVQIALLKDGMHLASRHVYEFKEPLDAEALAKLAVDKNISLKQAYDEMVAPRRTEFSTAVRAAEIAKAREEGAREFASKHKIPVDSAAREPEFARLSFTRDPKDAGIDDYVPNSGRLSPASENKLRSSFAEDYVRANSSSTSER